MAVQWIERRLNYGVALGCIAGRGYMVGLDYRAVAVEQDCNFEQLAVALACKVLEG